MNGSMTISLFARCTSPLGMDTASSPLQFVNAQTKPHPAIAQSTFMAFDANRSRPSIAKPVWAIANLSVSIVPDILVYK
jgi:hypothetical protein